MAKINNIQFLNRKLFLCNGVISNQSMHFSEIEILFEDNHLLAVNKPAGILVQPDKTGGDALEVLLKQYIKETYNKPGEVFLGVCHRIDRPVSGVVLFAKTSKALIRINEMFQKKEIRKTYWAVVADKPNSLSGTLTHWLKKDERKNISRAYDHEVTGSSKCVLDYRFLGSSKSYHLLEINPHTGRHHQIRVQLASMGCPIKGDVKYGSKRTNAGGGIHLHARKIEFEHPVKKEPIVIMAPLPQDVVWQAEYR